MSAELEGLLRALLADPSRLNGLAPEQALGLLASLRAVVTTERTAGLGRALTEPVAAWSGEDLLTIDEAAVALRVSPRWLYRHAKSVPFSRKLSRKVLRFSRAGIARWLATRRT